MLPGYEEKAWILPGIILFSVTNTQNNSHHTIISLMCRVSCEFWYLKHQHLIQSFLLLLLYVRLHQPFHFCHHDLRQMMTFQSDWRYSVSQSVTCLRGESEADIKRWCSGWDIHGWKYRLERCGRWSRISLISSAWTDSCSRYRVTSVNLCYPAGVWWERSTSRSPRPERGWIYSTLPPDPLDLHPSERV